MSTSLVDDDGVDLVFHRRGHAATMSVQVKARMSDGALVSTGRAQVNVREATFRPRPDLDIRAAVITAQAAVSTGDSEVVGSATGVPGHLGHVSAAVVV